MNKIIQYLLIIYIANPGFVWGMQTPPSSPRAQKNSPLKSPTPLVSPSRWTADIKCTQEKDIMPRIIEIIKETPAGGYIGIDNKYLTHQRLIVALEQAAKRGVRIELNAGSGVSKQIVERLQQAGIFVEHISDLHAKRYLIAQHDPHGQVNSNREQLGRTYVIMGSYNASCVAYGHKEVMEFVENDASYFNTNYQNFMRLAIRGDTPQKKSTISATPTKRTAVSSQEYDSLQSKSQRLRTLFDSEHIDDCVDITSMTFDTDEIVRALEEVMKERSAHPPHVRLFLDRAALNHKDLLDRLVDSGAHVYIYNPDGAKKVFGKIPALQHTKTIIRKCGGNFLVINSTGNLTQRSNKEINIDAYHPNDPKLFQEIQNMNNELLRESEEYGTQKAR